MHVEGKWNAVECEGRRSPQSSCCSPGNFDPTPRRVLSLHFSRLLMLFISIKPPAQPAAPAKGHFQPVKRAERCNGGADQHLTFALDLLLIYSGFLAGIRGGWKSTRDISLRQYLPALRERQSDSSPCRSLEFTLKDCSKLITAVALLHRNLTAFYRFLLDLS